MAILPGGMNEVVRIGDTALLQRVDPVIGLGGTDFRAVRDRVPLLR